MECERLLNDYVSWVLGQTQCKEIASGYLCIITPHQTPSGDLITAHVFDRGNRLVVTDRGTVLNHLRARGIDILGPRTSRARRDWLESVIEAYGATIELGQLTFSCERTDFGRTLIHFVDAVHELLGLEVTAKLKTKRLFKEDVRSYLQQSQVSFVENYEVQGRKAKHHVDFAVNNRERPTLIQTASTGSRTYSTILARLTTYPFLDLYKAGKAHTAVSLIDDEEDVWTEEALAILETGSDYVIGWSNRERLLEVIRYDTD